MTRQIHKPEEIERKLAMIAELTPREIRGWINQMREPGARQAFPGEREAVMVRMKRLGVRL